MKNICNFFILIVLLLFSVFIDMVLRFQFFELFIFNRSFPLLWGFIYIGYILGWIPIFIIFLLMGLSIFMLVNSKRPLFWSVGFGISASMFLIFYSDNYFSEDATFLDYFYRYSEYFIYPVSSTIGGIFASYLRSKLIQITVSNNKT